MKINARYTLETSCHDYIDKYNPNLKKINGFKILYIIPFEFFINRKKDIRIALDILKKNETFDIYQFKYKNRICWLNYNSFSGKRWASKKLDKLGNEGKLNWKYQNFYIDIKKILKITNKEIKEK